MNGSTDKLCGLPVHGRQTDQPERYLKLLSVASPWAMAHSHLNLSRTRDINSLNFKDFKRGHTSLSQTKPMLTI